MKKSVITGVKIMLASFFINLVGNTGYAEQIGLAQLLGSGIARFYAPNVKPENLPPSMSLAAEPKILGKVPDNWKIVPQFGIAPDGRKTANISIEKGTSLYGTGEVFGTLLRNGRK